MTPPGSPPRADATEWAGRALVALQFGLLAALGWRAWASPAPWSGWIAGLVLVSAGLAAWALAANRPGNFNIRPTPRDGGILVTGGPYRWIRHPMYTAVLFGAAAAVLKASRAADALLWLALLAVLVAKAAIEEQALAERDPTYRAYAARTRRFLPWWV